MLTTSCFFHTNSMVVKQALVSVYNPRVSRAQNVKLTLLTHLGQLEMFIMKISLPGRIKVVTSTP